MKQINLDEFVSLVRLSGFLHFLQPLSMFIAPKLLNLKEDLGRLSPLGNSIFLVLLRSFTLTIIGTGLIVITFPREFVIPNNLGNALSLFLAIFFIYRLYVQIFIYRPFWPMKGYGGKSHYGLSILFLYLSCFYSVVFLNGMSLIPMTKTG